MKYTYHSKMPLYNRESRKIEFESVFNNKLKGFLYGTSIGRVLTHAIMIRKIVSRVWGNQNKKAKSRKKIQPFIEKYNINIKEFVKPVSEFENFNEFFIRKLKPQARPIASRANQFIAPADGRLLACRITDDMLVPVKGVFFPLPGLLDNEKLARQYRNGYCLIFRLVPYDYHRFCHVDDGKQEPIKALKGYYHVSSPQPYIMRFFPVYHGNFREYSVLHTKNFGPVVDISVGAMTVGKTVQHKPNGGMVKRGEEKGYFEYGASTIILLIKPGAITLDADIEHYSQQGIESLVKYGSAIGIKVKK